uniref:BRX domain-containing protein n=1 Tax=Leersia perrieri TaxID=77586 RepID=A0A0D9W673_9ORYZ
MHACFHGGGGGRIRSICIIRELTKNMKAMSLKVKMAGNHGRARRRRRGRRPEDNDEDEEEMENQGKDIATAPSASAKIAPAQPQESDGHEEATTSGCGGNGGDRSKDEQGRKSQQHRDKCDGEELSPGHQTKAACAESDREWVAEPEPGVLMTLVARPDGTNHLRRIRFSEELFDGHREAQRWWEEHYDAIVELYSVVQPEPESSHDGDDDDDTDSVPATPCQSEDDDHGHRRGNPQGSDSASNFSGPSSGSGSGSGGRSASTVGSPILGLVTESGGGGARANQTEHSPT